VGEELKADSALGKAVAKIGDVLVYAVGKDLDAWIAKRFRESGIEIGRDACHTLREIVGDEKLLLDLEIGKLVTWARGEPLGVDEVRRLATPSREEAPWALTDAWGARDMGVALTVMENDLEQRPREIPRLVGQLGGHLHKLTSMKRLLEEGVAPKDAAGKLGMKPFPAQKLARQADGFSIEELRDASVRLARLDHALKGGSRLAPELELQLAITDLAREPR
jgi:DNA polymerase III delta subunit